MAESSDPSANVMQVPLEQLLGQSKSKADSLIDYSQLDQSKSFDSHNSTTVVCGSCKSIIMKPSCGRLVEKEMFLPSMTEKYLIGQEPLGDKPTIHWLVEDMFHFENIGFSKTVDSLQYLICADCEIGPIGWRDTTTNNKFYVACERVKYVSK